MRTKVALGWACAAVVVLGAGCKPDLGAPQSLITGPRILAVRGAPPEAAQGGMVTYDLLAVDVTGTVATPDVTWAHCLQPDPPAFTNAVSDACLDVTVTPDEAGPSPTFDATMPDDSCMLFGPETPPPMKGQPPARPSDPDTTGGYYQPVRAVWQTTGQVAFALERITCRLNNAPVSVASQYAMEYTANVNPKLADVALDPAGSVSAGQKVTLQADFSDDSAETFLLWDVVNLKLVQQRESLRVSWFATGGAFEHDATGRTADEVETFTQNQWTAPTTPGTVYFWTVLRDSRGGVDFATAQIDVTP